MRERMMLSQEELAARAGLSVSTVRGIEAGRINRPRPTTVRQLAGALNMSESDRDRLLAAARDARLPSRADLGGQGGGGQLDGDTASGKPGGPDRPAQSWIVVPAQLPAPVTEFTGRAEALRALDSLLDAGKDEPMAAVVISAVGGTAGVGKTALAVHWAHRVANQFPDGQLYVNLRGFDPSGRPVAPAAAVRGFLDALGVPPERVPAVAEAQYALFRSLLAGRQMLILLDNACSVEQVRPLLPGTGSALVLITSRNSLTSLVAAEGARPLTLDVLTTEEARELLCRRLGAGRVAAEPGAVDTIIVGCARLPLALAIVAARAAQSGLPLTAFAADLYDTGRRLDTLDAGDPVSQLRAVLSWSYTILTRPAARLFRLLGVHPGPDISAAAAASLAGCPPAQARPLLTELTRASLIAEHAPGRYTWHDLLRAYATELAAEDPEPERRAALARLLDHYTQTGHTAALLLDSARDPLVLTPPQPGTTPEHLADHQQAIAWFNAEHAVLLAAVDRAAASGFDTHTWQLAWTLTDFLYRRGHWHDWVAVQRAAVAAAGRLADPSVQAHAHRLLAVAYLRLSRFDDAHTQLRHSLDLTMRTDDLAGQAHTHQSLTLVCGQQGRQTEALDHARQALHLYRQTGHRRGQAVALNTVGWHHALLGEHQQTLSFCRQALRLHQQLNDDIGLAATWDSLGYAHHHLGQHARAIACYQHAFTLYRNLGARYAEADTLTHLGDTHHAAGNPQAARTAWQQALAILNELDHPDTDQLRTKLAALPGTGPTP